MDNISKTCQSMIKMVVYSILNVMIPFYDIIHSIVSILTNKPYYSKKLYTMTLMVMLFVILVMVSCYIIFRLTNILTVVMIMLVLLTIFILYTKYCLAKEYSKNRFYFLSCA